MVKYYVEAKSPVEKFAEEKANFSLYIQDENVEFGPFDDPEFVVDLAQFLYEKQYRDIDIVMIYESRRRYPNGNSNFE